MFYSLPKIKLQFCFDCQFWPKIILYTFWALFCYNVQESLSLQSFWFEKLYSLDTILSASRLLDAAINMWWWHTINVSDTLLMIHQLSVWRVKMQSKLLWSRMTTYFFPCIGFHETFFFVITQTHTAIPYREITG